MTRVALAAVLLLAGCASMRRPAEPTRGFATEGTIDCASLILDQRGYVVNYSPRRRELRAVKEFRSGAQNLVAHAILTARLEPAGSRAVLAVRTERRFGNPPQDNRRQRRPVSSAYFAAGSVDEDARTVLEQCTTSPAPD
jgi:hypothetical protein